MFDPVVKFIACELFLLFFAFELFSIYIGTISRPTTTMSLTHLQHQMNANGEYHDLSKVTHN